jgi:signal transduction histidine kinase
MAHGDAHSTGGDVPLELFDGEPSVETGAEATGSTEAKGLMGASALFRTALRGPLKDDLRAAQRDVILARTIVLIWISVFVMPSAILSYVYFLARPQFGQATTIVCGAVALVLLHRWLVKRGVFDRHYHVAMLLLVGGVFGPTGTAIVEITRNGAGDFLFAFYLIYFAFTALFPAEIAWIFITSGAITFSYVGGRWMRPGGLVLDADLIQKIIYFLELTFIGTALNRVVYRLFFDERRAQIELARANRSLRELDQAKSNFFSNISHEIRTPLTLILTPLTHILQTLRDSLPPDLTAKLEGMRGNANRLLKMVNALLDFAKLEAGQARLSWSELALGDVVTYAGSLFAAAAESRGVSLVVRSEVVDLQVQSDLDKLEKILINLVGNAIKFTPRGGTVTVRATHALDQFTIEVADTGIGIPPEHQEAVFQRFTQLDSGGQASVRGTGLGLAMVREYARLLKGDVRLESAVGRGSTFTVTLPVCPPSERTRANSSNPPEPRPSRALEGELAVADLVATPRQQVRVIDKAGPGRPRILVVDDNAALVGLVCSILEREYNLFLASDGEQALERVARDPVDLIVSDVMMPGIDGLELVKRLRANERTRHLPIILLTARGGAVQKVEGLETGADDYIGKPFDPGELLARVRSLFELRRTTRSLAEKSRELEAAMARLKDEELKVIESEKLRTLGELAAGVFHELHNYLNIVCNGAVPLKESLDEMKEAIRGGARAVDVGAFDDLVALASVMADAAVAARSVSGELKGYAHQDHSGIPKLADLNGVVQSTVRLFGAGNRAVKVVLNLSDEPIAVECVPTRLGQVFTNLIKNAFEACGDDGTVEIATQIHGGVAVATVTDTGPGVLPQQLPKLFEPFHTTKKQGEGLGLGLSLSRKVMHDLGGDLRYDGMYRDGARFVVTLPVKAASRHATASPSVPAPPP